MFIDHSDSNVRDVNDHMDKAKANMVASYTTITCLIDVFPSNTTAESQCNPNQKYTLQQWLPLLLMLSH